MIGKLVYVVGVSAVTAVLACASSGGGSGGGSDSGGAGGGGSCGWHGNCSSRAPNGAYDCSGDSLMQCVNGSWTSVVGCGSTHDSKGYACNCKGGCGMNTTACSYAFATCEGNSYPTCGPNAQPVLTDTWQCE